MVPQIPTVKSQRFGQFLSFGKIGFGLRLQARMK
jgi:hypothetical protein